MKAFRDPVHNIILFDKDSEKLLLDLIDTREFQRLRQIRQLGVSFFTYPGAEHSRFVHSLGATHLMKRFIDKLSNLKGRIAQDYVKELNENRMLGLVAALLHDIGHGPFSHALEKTTKIEHEKWTIAIILGNTEINQLLENYQKGFAKEVADVIQRTHRSKPIVKLLSSQLDVDRIDYLLRDSKMSGAGYGSFDLEWMINVLRIGEVHGDVEIGLDLDKGLSIAEDFVMARTYMYKNVYFHKATRCAELIIDKIFERALELSQENRVELTLDFQQVLQARKEIKEVKEKTKENRDEMSILQKYLNNYLNLTDSTFWHYFSLWSQSEDPILSDLCQRLLKRKLFKPIEFSFESYERLFHIFAENNINRNYYLLHDKATSSSYKDPYILQKPKSKEGEKEYEASEQIFLFDRNGYAHELSNVSEIIRQIRNKSIVQERYFIPGEYKEDLLKS